MNYSFIVPLSWHLIIKTLNSKDVILVEKPLMKYSQVLKKY